MVLETPAMTKHLPISDHDYKPCRSGRAGRGNRRPRPLADLSDLEGIAWLPLRHPCRRHRWAGVR